MSRIRKFLEGKARELSQIGLLPYLSRTLGGDTNFKIAKYDQLTGKAVLPSGESIDVEPVGMPSKYTALQVTGKTGVVFADQSTQMSVMGSKKKAYIAYNISNQIKVRYLGDDVLYDIPVTIPEEAKEVQAYFTSNCKHFMVGWWQKSNTAPYHSSATYHLFTDFSCDKVSGEFRFEGTESQTIQLNDVANGVLQCPGPGETFSEFIWFNHPPQDGRTGDYARFFPITSSYYTTTTDPYEWTFFPECSNNFHVTSQSQEGTYTSNWYMDGYTLADFKSVRFSFNNNLAGDPVIDIVTSFRACVAGMMMQQEHTDIQNYYDLNHITYAIECKKSATRQQDQACTNYRKNTFTYEYTYDFIGPDALDYTATDTSDDYDLWTEGRILNFTHTCEDEVVPCGPGSSYSYTGYTRLYPNILLGNGGTGLPYLEVDVDDGFVMSVDWYQQFFGTAPAVPLPYPPDYTEFFVTTYDGVTKPVRYPGNPDGYVSSPEVFAFLRPNRLAGLWCSQYYHYTITPLGPFARDYYFAMAVMAIRGVNISGTSTIEWDGRPPLTEKDFNTNISTFLGIDGQTGLVWKQENYPTDSVYVDPADDVSFQAILEILRDTGDEALLLLADYLENNAGLDGTVYTNTKAVYWASGSYTSDPFYGYDNNYDVATDIVIAPGGTFPFKNSYLKGLDSYIILGYNAEEGNETVTVYTVEVTGATSILFKTSKSLKYSSGGDILDVGIKYERPIES